MKSIYDENGLPTPVSPSAEDEFFAEPEPAPLITVDELHEGLRFLTAKQSFVIRCRYLMQKQPCYSLGEVADMMGISERSVLDIEQAAITKLEKHLLKRPQEGSPLTEDFDNVEVRETHKAHPSDWKQTYNSAGPTLQYVGSTTGYYVAPGVEDWGSDEAEVCYFLHAPEVGRVKIGHTNALKKRIYALRGSSPTRLELVGTVIGGSAREKNLHERFRDFRVFGEWFTDEILPQLEELVQEDAQ